MANKTDGSEVVAGCAIFLIMPLLLGAVTGYVLNIIDLVNLAFVNDPVTPMFLLRIVGIFFVPLGCVLGWL